MGLNVLRHNIFAESENVGIATKLALSLKAQDMNAGINANQVKSAANQLSTFYIASVQMPDGSQKNLEKSYPCFLSMASLDKSVE